MQSKTLTALFSTSGPKLLQLQGSSLALNKSVLAIDPDIMFLTRPKFFNSLTRSSSLVKSDGITTPRFSTSTKRVQLNSENISSKLVSQEIFSQAPAKFFTRRAEEETVVVEGIGWAGQPIVKRLHTILPEVNGDISDILKAAKRSKAISEVGNNLDVKMRNFGRSHDIIAVINENAKNKMKENVNFNKTRNRLLHSKKEKIHLRNSGILTKNPIKLKKKKRTVVLASKPAIIKSSIKRKLYKKKEPKRPKNLVSNQSFRIQPSRVMIRQLSTMPLSRPVFHVVNRQFQTFSALGYAKKGKSSKDASVPKAHIDDCVCPVVLYTTGKRKSTKICGEAHGAGEKKKITWKQKMCRVGPKMDHGPQKTLVCLSEHAKLGKRKKELPKCPEPEIKVVPRVIICAPNLIDEEEAKKKKECVKIEEEKIRKRTKVCKPVMIMANEEVGVHIEKKAVCTSSQIKKVVSRHTKICPPS